MSPSTTKAAALTWAQLRPPATAEERMVYLEACQRQFEVVSATGPVSGALCVMQAPQSAPQSVTTFTAFDNAPTPCLNAACAVCAAEAHAAVIANPFSDWAVVLCPACTPR